MKIVLHSTYSSWFQISFIFFYTKSLGILGKILILTNIQMGGEKPPTSIVFSWNVEIDVELHEAMKL